MTGGEQCGFPKGPEQLIDGFYCDLCGHGFVASEWLKAEGNTRSR